MLSTIQVHDELGSFLTSLPVSVQNPTVSFYVTEISGLGPVQATISSSTSSGQDGVAIQTSRLGSRNIVLKVAYDPDYQQNETVQSLRRDLYNYFAPKREVSLEFIHDDFATLRIVGVVESHEPVVFSKEPEVSISLICEDPYFKGLTPTEINAFNNTEIFPSFVGNGEAGFLLELFVTRSISSVSIECAPNETIVYTGDMQANDILQISTVRGNKYARLTRGGATETVLDGISGSMDMVLNSITRSLWVKTTGSSDMTFRLTHTPTYIGI